MQLLKRVVIMLIVAALGVTVVPAGAAQEQNVAQGQLLRLDLNAKKIVIKTETGSQMQFEYTEQTVVSGADESVEGLGTETGTFVTVKYEKQETRMLAMQVEVHKRQ